MGCCVVTTATIADNATNTEFYDSDLYKAIRYESCDSFAMHSPNYNRLVEAIKNASTEHIIESLKMNLVRNNTALTCAFFYSPHISIHLLEKYYRPMSIHTYKICILHRVEYNPSYFILDILKMHSQYDGLTAILDRRTNAGVKSLLFPSTISEYVPLATIMENANNQQWIKRYIERECLYDYRCHKYIFDNVYTSYINTICTHENGIKRFSLQKMLMLYANPYVYYPAFSEILIKKFKKYPKLYAKYALDLCVLGLKSGNYDLFATAFPYTNKKKFLESLTFESPHIGNTDSHERDAMHRIINNCIVTPKYDEIRPNDLRYYKTIYNKLQIRQIFPNFILLNNRIIHAILCDAEVQKLIEPKYVFPIFTMRDVHINEYDRAGIIVKYQIGPLSIYDRYVIPQLVIYKKPRTCVNKPECKFSEKHIKNSAQPYVDAVYRKLRPFMDDANVIDIVLGDYVF